MKRNVKKLIIVISSMFILVFLNSAINVFAEDMMNVYKYEEPFLYMATIRASHFKAWYNEGWTYSFPIKDWDLFWEEKSLFGNNKVLRLGSVDWYDDTQWEYLRGKDDPDQIKILTTLRVYSLVYDAKHETFSRAVFPMDVNVRNVFATNNWRKILGQNATSGDFMAAVTEKIQYDMTEIGIPYIRNQTYVKVDARAGGIYDVAYGFIGYWWDQDIFVGFKDGHVTNVESLY